MVYGYGTQSHLRSTEYKQLQKERTEFTKKYEAGEIKFATVEIKRCCTCLSFRHPHTLDAHKKLRSEHDWRPFQVREREESAGWQEWGVNR